MEPQSHIEKHISFLDMLQSGELLRNELLTLPVQRGVGMTPQRFFEDNSAQNKPKLAKFLLI